jgi:hypothetical protein
MGHGRDKPGREKRKPKKEKLTVAKTARESDVLQHVAQHAHAPDEQPKV